MRTVIVSLVYIRHYWEDLAYFLAPGNILKEHRSCSWKEYEIFAKHNQ